MKILPEAQKNEQVEKWLAREEGNLEEFLASQGKKPTEQEQAIIDRERLIKRYR